MSQAPNWGVPAAGPCLPTTYAARDNDSFNALLSSNSGPAAPAYAIAGTRWLDTSNAAAWAMKIYDGSDWNIEWTLNPNTNAFSDPNASTKMPSGTVVGMAFRYYSSPALITAEIPFNDMPPDITKGIEIMRIDYAAKSASNRILGLINGNFATAGTGTLSAACTAFRSQSGVNYNEAAEALMLPLNGVLLPISTMFTTVPGTTATQSYTVRVGKQTGTPTIGINAGPASRIFTNYPFWMFVLLEIKG